MGMVRFKGIAQDQQSRGKEPGALSGPRARDGQLFLAIDVFRDLLVYEKMSLPITNALPLFLEGRD